MPPTKNIIITGAGGLIGPLLATRLLNDPSYKVLLTDLVEPILPQGISYPENATRLRGDITSSSFINTLLTHPAHQPLDAVFIFHGIMSAGSEANPDLSLRVNVDSVRALLLAIRDLPPITSGGKEEEKGKGKGKVRVIYASSQAVYGQPLPSGPVTDDITPTPEGTYGAHKLMSEVFLNEMHRRGYLEGFSLRFPSIVVRPGRPTNAASSFLSGMIREPMNGETCVIPLRDRGFRSFLSSPSALQENLFRVLHMPADSLPPHVRHINVPGVSVSIQELMDALAKHGGEDKLKLLKEETDPDLERILRSWSPDFDNSTALRLGLVKDESGEDIVKEYIDSLKK